MVDIVSGDKVLILCEEGFFICLIPELWVWLALRGSPMNGSVRLAYVTKWYLVRDNGL